ncbi:MAM domain-containing glycosylphosphatidylinositol anchor protein 2, partial [Xenoophorus captivus]
DLYLKYVLDIIDICFFPPQIRWTKTAGSVSDRFQDSSVFNDTLHIAKIQRTQGGRYYCKAENGLGSPAIKSIRVDVYCKF